MGENMIVPVETQNVRAVKNAVRSAVNNNGMMAVVADVGSGKTTMFNYLADYWNSNPQKFRVITVKAFESINTKIGVIMRLMMESVNSDVHVPRGIERQYKVLTDELFRFTRNRSNRVILMIDEAQDLNYQTFMDIKKIHEIAGNGMKNMFSVILFGKPHRKWDKLYAGPEIGYRMNMVLLEDLTQDEMVRIAEQRFSLSFASDTVRKRFAVSVKYKTPLGIEFFSKALKKELGLDEGESAHVNAELVTKIPMLSLKIRAKQAGVKQRDVAEAGRELIKHKKVNEQRVSEFFNNNLDDEQLSSELTIITEELINSRLTNKRRRISGKAI